MTRIRSLLFSAVMMLVAQLACAEVAYKDVSYGKGERNQLDIYLPRMAKNPPVVLFIHGGRWFRNDKTQVKLYDRVGSLIDAGIAVVAMNYTYSTQRIWPAQKNDVLSALKFISENGKTYGYDSSRIAVWGQSSGAHLTLWAALLSARDPTIDIDAVISWYAPSDLFQLQADRLKDRKQTVESSSPGPAPEDILIGSKVTAHRQDADAASPGPQIEKSPRNMKFPSMLLMHGTADSIVSPRQSQRLYNTIMQRDPGADVSLVLVKGAGHGGDGWGSMVKEVIDFLRPRLGLSEAE